jgi:hypothetical protein
MYTHWAFAGQNESIYNWKEVVTSVWQVAQFCKFEPGGGSGLSFFGDLDGTHPLVRTQPPELDCGTTSLLFNPEPWEKHFLKN